MSSNTSSQAPSAVDSPCTALSTQLFNKHGQRIVPLPEGEDLNGGVNDHLFDETQDENSDINE